MLERLPVLGGRSPQWKTVTLGVPDGACGPPAIQPGRGLPGSDEMAGGSPCQASTLRLWQVMECCVPYSGLADEQFLRPHALAQ